MFKIALMRVGRKKLPFFRIVALDSRRKMGGFYTELLGTYQPLTGQIKLVDNAIIKHLANGAQPTKTVNEILRKHGVLQKFQATKRTG